MTLFSLALGVILAAHFLLGLAVAGSFTPDDADQLIFSQSLAWGYYEQPPLYTWLTWFCFQLFGLSFFGYCLLKTAVLGLIYVATFGCARLLFRDQPTAAVAAFLPVLIPTFAWHSFSYLTSTNLVCAAGAATLWLLLRLQRGGRWSDYLLLGVVLGLGTLSKYNYLFLASALILAGLTMRSLRARLLSPRMLVTFVIALLIILPHGLWLIDQRDALIAVLNRNLSGGSGEILKGRAAGVVSLMTNSFLILLPAAIVFALLFWRGAKMGKPRAEDWSDGQRLLGRFFIAALFVLIVFVIVGGAARFHERWLQPFTLLAPMWCLSLLGLSRPMPLRRLSSVLIGCALLCCAVRGGQVFFGGFDRGTYPLRMNFSFAADQLRTAAAVLPGSVVIASDREIAGNLRFRLPEARHLCSAHPLYVPPLDDSKGPWVLIWNTRGGETPPSALVSFVRQQWKMEVPESAPINIAEVPSRISGRRSNRLGYIVITDFRPAG